MLINSLKQAIAAISRSYRLGEAIFCCDQPSSTKTKSETQRKPNAPEVIAEVEVGIDPQGVSLDANGTTLALATKEAGAPLTFVTFTNGQFGEPVQLPMSGFSPIDEQAQHFVVGGASLPRHAESIAFSNDGKLIATSNIGQTWLSPNEPGYGQSSLSLVQFDTATGQVTHAGDWTFDGILPEGVEFDASNQYVVAGVFEYETPEPRQGALEFWRVIRTGSIPQLERTDYIIETGPGAHSLIVVN